MGLTVSSHLKRNGIIIISVLCVLQLVMTFQKMNRLSTNPRSRIISVERIVDAGTWAHMTPTDTSRFHLSNDMVKIGDRYYSSKPPLYPVVMAAQALAINGITGWNFYEHRVDYLRVLVFLNQILPYCLMLWSLWAFLLRHIKSEWTAYYMLLCLSIGSLAYAYSVTINNHTPSAILYVFVFLLWEGISRRGRGEWWRYALLGLACGTAFSIELPSGGIAAWFIFLCLMQDRKLGALAILFALIPFLANLYLYYYISGVWKPFYLQSGIYRFEGSYWSNPEGIDAERPDKLTYIFHMLFGRRGLFSITPVLLLGVIGAFRHIFTRSGDFFKREFAGIGVGILMLIVFVIFRTWNYGGVCVGMRWFICFMPFLLLMAIPQVEKMQQKLWGRVLLGVMLAWSIPWTIDVMYEEAFIIGLFERTWVSVF